MKAVLADGLQKPAEVDFNVAYSGGKLMLPDWELPVVFDLKTTTVHDNIPIFLYHSATRRVGTVTEYSIEPTSIALKGIIIRSLPDAKTVLDVHEAGGSWECSVGTGPIEDKNIELIKEGFINVNEQTIEAPCYLLHNVEVREVSFVGAGADNRTSLEIRASLYSIQKDSNIMENEMFQDFVNSLGLKWETLDEDNKQNLYAAWQLKCEAETPAETVEAGAMEEPEKEEEKEEEKKVEASAISSANTRIQKMSSVNRPSGRSVRPSEARIIEASLLLQNASGEAVERAGYNQTEINEACSRDYRNVGLHGLMRRAVKASGLYLPQDCSSKELVRTYHEAIQASGLSTRDFSPSGIMSNVADKMLRIQADQINTVANDIFYKRSVKNFNRVTSGKLTSIGAISETLPGEDFPNVMLSDDSQDYKVTKRGVNLCITLEDQVNDDLGAFERALSQFGRLFANTIDQVAIGSLMSQAATIFTGGKKKTLAFSADNLKTVVGAFARIKDKGGEYRNLVPGAILTSPETAIAARALFVFNDRSSIAPQDSKEVISTPYNVYSTPYIEATDGWFLLPRDEKIGEVAYLNGNSAPAVESAALNTKNLNLEYVVWGTCGVLIYNDAPAIYSKPA